jgi:hypothetical protein
MLERLGKLWKGRLERMEQQAKEELEKGGDK